MVISAKPVHRQAILDQVRRFGVPAEVVGAVSGERLIGSVGDGDSTESVIDQPVAMLHDRWSLSLERELNQVDA